MYVYPYVRTHTYICALEVFINWPVDAENGVQIFMNLMGLLTHKIKVYIYHVKVTRLRTLLCYKHIRIIYVLHGHYMA